MAPSLRVLTDGEIRRSRRVIEEAAAQLGLTDPQRAITIPSGGEQWLNRGNWALSYLTRAGATERTSRAHYRITDVGRQLLSDHPEGVTERHLRALSGNENAPNTFKAFPAPGGEPSEPAAEVETTLEPLEQVEAGIARIHADVAAQLLDRIHSQEPVFFEQAVLDLMMAMGYGGAEGTATPTQLSNDGGIDGIVDQDALGLSRIYLQAKRYAVEMSIGRPEIQAFVGALQGVQANQGVFITTAQFTRSARDYAEAVPSRVILIDGARLTSLMIRYGVGVQVRQTVRIVEVDEDFFE
jgi:restriction system protein